jgi:hypothetical protein
MLDLRAAGQDGRPDALRAVGVDERAQAEGACLATGGLELGVAQRLAAALPDALGGEDLDEIGAIGLVLDHRLAQLFGSAGPVVQGLERGEQPRSGNLAPGDRVPHLLVLPGPGTLHGRKAGEQVV